MKGRYEIRDTLTPGARGQRYTSLTRAIMEFRRAVGTPGRWILVDRQTNEVLDRS